MRKHLLLSKEASQVCKACTRLICISAEVTDVLGQVSEIVIMLLFLSEASSRSSSRCVRSLRDLMFKCNSST